MSDKDYSQGAAYVYGQYVSLDGAMIPDLGYGLYACGCVLRRGEHMERQFFFV